MTWQRTARWIVAALGIGCAIAIAAYGRRRPPPPAPPRVLETTDPAVKTAGGAGQTVINRTGKAPIRIDYASSQSYEDGRGRFEQVVIRGLEESRYEVRAGVMETSAALAGTDEPQRLLFSGGVKLTTDDGLEVNGDTATWDGRTNQMSMPGPLSFKKGRMSGTGVGATFDRQKDAFTLLEEARAHVDVDKEGHGGADLSSSKMTMVRGQHMVQLIDNAKIVGEAQTLTGRNATLTFADDDSRVKYLELTGGARVAANPGTTSTRPAMSADLITMSFYEDGATLQHATLTGQSVLTLSGAAPRSVSASWIDLDTAKDGQTLTSLRARDQVKVSIAPTAEAPGRVITSNVLTATGEEKKGLTSARFEGNPRFEETAPAPPRGGASVSGPPLRTGTSMILVLTLGGQIDAIESAEFQQNAKFTDGDVTGEADIARYDEAKQRLLLLPSLREPRKLSLVTTADMKVWATTIDVDTKNDDLLAQGSVATRSIPAPGAARSGSLFGGEDPIRGSADTLRFTKSSGTAVYTGTKLSPAWLSQPGQSEVRADRIEYIDKTRNLDASGNVQSTWLLGTGAKGEQLKRQDVRAETLAYDEAARTAVYKGSPVRVSTSDSEVEGRTVTFRLAEASRTLETMRAQTSAWATLSGGYEGVGDVLTYDAKTEVYTLDGRPGDQGVAKVKSPPSERSGTASPGTKPLCNLNEAMRLVLDRKTGGVSIPGDGNAPRPTTQVACTMSLRPPK